MSTSVNILYIIYSICIFSHLTWTHREALFSKCLPPDLEVGVSKSQTGGILARSQIDQGPLETNITKLRWRNIIQGCRSKIQDHKSWKFIRKQGCRFGPESSRQTLVKHQYLVDPICYHLWRLVSETV